MNRIRNLVGVLLIAGALLAPPGCSYLMGKAAIEVGKKAFKEITKDRDKNQPNKQPTSKPAKNSPE